MGEGDWSRCRTGPMRGQGVRHVHAVLSCDGIAISRIVQEGDVDPNERSPIRRHHLPTYDGHEAVGQTKHNNVSISISILYNSVSQSSPRGPAGKSLLKLDCLSWEQKQTVSGFSRTEMGHAALYSHHYVTHTGQPY